MDPACETESEESPTSSVSALPRLLPPLCSRLRSVSALCSTLRAETESEAEQRQHEGKRRKAAELSRDTERGRRTPYLRGAAPAAWHVSRETCTAHITRLRTARDVRLSACQHVSIRIRTPVHVSKRCHHKSPGSKVSAHITRLRTASAVRLSACQHVSMLAWRAVSVGIRTPVHVSRGVHVSPHITRLRTACACQQGNRVVSRGHAHPLTDAAGIRTLVRVSRGIYTLAHGHTSPGCGS